MKRFVIDFLKQMVKWFEDLRLGTSTLLFLLWIVILFPRLININLTHTLVKIHNTNTFTNANYVIRGFH